MIYAGIDEAGYGPTLGPLCHGVAAFRVPGTALEEAPDLFALLAPAVRSAGKGEGLLVADSKKLFTRHQRSPLEDAALTFLELRGPRLPRPTPVGALLAALGASGEEELPWELGPDPESGFLEKAQRERVEQHAGQVRARLIAKELELVHLRAMALQPAGFNAITARTENKSSTTFTRVRDGLVALWEEFGLEGVHVQVDKQGGRHFYLPQLQEVFPLFAIRPVSEKRDESIYEVAADGRHLRVTFAPRSEERHLPVALASIAAKLVRELYMDRLNAWFAPKVPELRPTAGYPQDAKRWLEDTEELRRRLEISDDSLVRSR